MSATNNMNWDEALKEGLVDPSCEIHYYHMADGRCTCPSGHGLKEALYYGGPGEPYFQPVMECTCGWSTERSMNWEEAGRSFDEHLEQIKRRTKT